MRILFVILLIVTGCASETPKPTATSAKKEPVASSKTEQIARGPDESLLLLVEKAEKLRASDPQTAVAMFQQAGELFDDLNSESKITDAGRDAGAHAQFRIYEHDMTELLATFHHLSVEELAKEREKVKDGAYWVRSYRQTKWSALADELKTKVLSEIGVR